MKALDFPLLADENVHVDVITFLRKAKVDVESISEQGKFGITDKEVLLEAIRDNAPDVTPPFILVAERTDDIVKIRVRQL